jgi:Mg-chelatase subunit ChlD
LKFSTKLILIGTLWLTSPAYADDSLRITRPTDKQTSASEAPATAPERPRLRVSLPDKPQEGGSKSNVGLPNVGLTQVELQRLAAHDIVLLVDKSGSMHTPDCPSPKLGKLGTISSLVLNGPGMGISRWDWCQEQTSQMAKQTETVLPNGFSVLLFDTRFFVYPHVNVDQLAKIFRQNEPQGGTLLTEPLTSTFNDYFRRKEQSRDHVKPLLIGVITDGCPNDPMPTTEAIVSATHTMRNPSEITVIFFLIGSHDRRGEQFVWNISHNLGSEGASFNIVKGVPFQELERAGLARALADNLD